MLTILDAQLRQAERAERAALRVRREEPAGAVVSRRVRRDRPRAARTRERAATRRQEAAVEEAAVLLGAAQAPLARRALLVRQEAEVPAARCASTPILRLRPRRCGRPSISPGRR